ncbi:MAG: ribbon-helix-helix protein, CopG family [Anaerolineales bacterium]
MSERKYRAQILLEPEQHQVLSEIAQQQGQSISHVVREIVGQYIGEREQILQNQRNFLLSIKQHRAEILAKRKGKPLEVDVATLITQMREERTNDQLSTILAPRD